MAKRTGAKLEDRIAALSARIDDALERVQTWTPRPTRDARTEGVDEPLRAALEHAQANVTLQAQRCLALEDRVVELEAAIVGAGEARAGAEAIAEQAQREAEAAIDQLDEARGRGDANLGANLGANMQEKLLAIERLTRERDSLRSSSADWRTKARTYRRERDDAAQALSSASAELEELRARDSSSQRKLGELERRVVEQARELEVTTKRAKHLRQHIGSSTGGR